MLNTTTAKGQHYQNGSFLKSAEMFWCMTLVDTWGHSKSLVDTYRRHQGCVRELLNWAIYVSIFVLHFSKIGKAMLITCWSSWRKPRPSQSPKEPPTWWKSLGIDCYIFIWDIASLDSLIVQITPISWQPFLQNVKLCINN